MSKAAIRNNQIKGIKGPSLHPSGMVGIARRGVVSVWRVAAVESRSTFIDDECIGLQLLRFPAQNQLEPVLEQSLQQPEHLAPSDGVF